MSTREIDRTIARYLDGAMSLEEEEEFFVRMALDNDVRRAYQAQRVVENALHKQRQAAPRPALEMRSRLVQAMTLDGNVEKPGISNPTERDIPAVGRRLSIESTIRSLAGLVSIGVVVTAIVVISDNDPAAQLPVPFDTVRTEAIAPSTPPARRIDSQVVAEPVVTGPAGAPPHATGIDRGRSPNAASKSITDRKYHIPNEIEESVATPDLGTHQQQSEGATLPDTSTPELPNQRTTANGSRADHEQVDTIKLNVRVKMPD